MWGSSIQNQANEGSPCQCQSVTGMSRKKGLTNEEALTHHSFTWITYWPTQRATQGSHGAKQPLRRHSEKTLEPTETDCRANHRCGSKVFSIPPSEV